MPQFDTAATRLRNCAAWHIRQRDRKWNTDRAAAERHDAIAFRLFGVARDLMTTGATVPAYGARKAAA